MLKGEGKTMKVKVTADSTCDLSPELLARYDVTLAPLTVIKDGQAFADGVTITPRDIFMHVAAGGSLCSTAAVSVGEYQASFFPLRRVLRRIGSYYDWRGVFHLLPKRLPRRSGIPLCACGGFPQPVHRTGACGPGGLAGWGSGAPAWTSSAGSWRS